MDRYEKLTNDLGDNVAGAIERIRDAQVTAIRRVRARIELPAAVKTRVGSLRKLVQANHNLVRALTEAQRDYAFGLIDAWTAAPRTKKRSTRA
jgi:hypothetical protein